MTKLTQAHGNWVAGEDRFWDREHEIDLFIQSLDEGANLHIVAQRRIGKTSLMREVSRRIEDRYICLHVDLQTAQTAEDLIVELSVATHPHKSLWHKTREVFSNIFGQAVGSIESLEIDEVTVKIRDGLLGGNWQAKGNRLLAALATSEKPIVIFMDEVPILVNRMLKGADYQMTPERVEATDQFMSWLRKNSLAHQGKICFVVTGSIGFEPILRQARLSATINHFEPFEIEPWDAETAMGCLQALANNYGVTFEEGAPERVTERLNSCIPHHVQMFFSHIYKMSKKRGDMACRVEDVDEVYEKYMLSSKGHAELSTFEERLKMMVGDAMLPFILDLLTEAALAGRLSAKALAFYRTEHDLDGSEGRDKTREVIDILEHDGYLRQRPEGYVFVSYLLRDWWKRRFGFGFSIASEREG